MAAINVLDYENYIRSYIVNKLNALRPELDVSSDSVVDDIYIKPLIAVVTPLLQAANAVDLMRDLDNYIYMTDDQIDQIGSQNYFLSRNIGETARIMIKLSFVKVSSTENVIIPAGMVFETDNNLKYQTEDRLEYTPEELLAKYNPSTLTYDVLIEGVALASGADYNIVSGQTLTPLVKFSNYLISSKCASLSKKGYDDESNANYVSRIRTFYTSQFLGSKTGYATEIQAEFSEVNGVFVAGYGDEEMTRDLYTVQVGEVPTEVHIGGKVDIYIKGVSYENITEQIAINSPQLLLDASEVTYPTEVSLDLVVTKLIAGVETPVSTYTAATTDSGLWYVLIDSSEYDPDVITQFTVTYDSVNTATFNVGLTEFDLQSPFKNIVSIVSNDDSQTVMSESGYTTARYDISGNAIDENSIYYMTSQETATLRIVDFTGINNGALYQLTYNINKTLNDLVTYFELDENRIVTADVLIKEAEAMPVNIWLKAQAASDAALTENQIADISAAVNNFFTALQLGDDVQESDLISYLYNNIISAPHINYIELPLITFTSPVDAGAAITEDLSHATSISVPRNAYATLNKIKIESVT